MLRNYTCDCLGDSFSGRHCEIASTAATVLKIVAKTLGFVAIISLVTVVVFVNGMDIMKYWLGIDATAAEIQEIRKEKAKKKSETWFGRALHLCQSPSTYDQGDDRLTFTFSDLWIHFVCEHAFVCALSTYRLLVSFSRLLKFLSIRQYELWLALVKEVRCASNLLCGKKGQSKSMRHLLCNPGEISPRLATFFHQKKSSQCFPLLIESLLSRSIEKLFNPMNIQSLLRIFAEQRSSSSIRSRAVQSNQEDFFIDERIYFEKHWLQEIDFSLIRQLSIDYFKNL